MKIKVCGMRDQNNINSVAQIPVDILGFIFYAKSKRFVGDDFNITFPANTLKTGVFVNETIENILSLEQRYSLDFLQIHGDESADYCNELAGKTKAQVVKAFQVYEEFDFTLLKAYQPYCNYFLFDTKCSTYGGSGKKFNWSVLDKYTLNTPFFLSGGIGEDDAEIIAGFKHPQLFALDLNSKFEIEPALKDVAALKRFVEKVRK